MYFLSLKDVLIRTKSGSHDARIPANTPTFLVETLHEAAAAGGCVPCDAEGKVISYEEAEKVAAAAPAEVAAEPVEEAPAEEAPAEPDAVVSAVQAVLARNKASDFLASGRPSSASVAKELGYKVSSEEIDAAWQAVTEGLD